jgi:predicted transcriptional regulator
MITENLSLNVNNGFYNIKNCLDRDNKEISTRYALGDISKAYGVSKENARYMIGKEILKEKNNGVKVSDAAQKYGISKSTIYTYMKLEKPKEEKSQQIYATNNLEEKVSPVIPKNPVINEIPDTKIPNVPQEVISQEKQGKKY